MASRTALLSLLLQLLAALLLVVGGREIYDPCEPTNFTCFFLILLPHLTDNVFCGAKNCYEILRLQRDATAKQIKKAYHRLSLVLHPDKNKDANATEVFRLVSKAHEVLSNATARENFDYYLDHPRAYFKVSGHYYLKDLPKSNAVVILFITSLLISWLLYTIQYQKWERAIKYLKTATINNLGPKNGGTRDTLDLYKRSVDLYDAHVREARGAGDRNAGKLKMNKDPAFEKIVESLVLEVKIEGGHRKPTWKDLFVYQLLILPYSSVVIGMKYYRFLVLRQMSAEEREEIAVERTGAGTWSELSAKERAKIMETIKPETLLASYFSGGAAAAAQEEEEEDAPAPPGAVFAKKSKRKNK